MTKLKINTLTVGLNTPEFEKVFSPMRIDSRGHPMAYELVLLTGMCGELIKEHQEAYEVKFPFYPKAVFVLKRHMSLIEHERNYEKLSLSQIQDRLRLAIGHPYLWGGNQLSQTESLKQFYGQYALGKREERAIKLHGIDCSGLLFYATHFQTPRNTKELQTYGRSLSDPHDLKPLDLILTLGHVKIVLDDKHVIQSRQNRGVYISKIEDEMRRHFKKLKLVDVVTSKEEFSLRRFYF